MSIQLSGILVDGTGSNLSNTDIILESCSNTWEIIMGVVGVYTTSNIGEYSFNCPVGNYIVITQRPGSPAAVAGKITIYSDSVNTTLNDLLQDVDSEMITPAILAEIKKYRNEAVEAKNTAVDAANTSVSASDVSVSARNEAVEAKNTAVDAANTSVSASDVSVSARNEAVEAKNQTQQIIDDAGEQSTLVVLAQADGAKKPGYRLRNVFTRLDDEVSILDFGTADNACAAMQAAIDHVVAKGGGNIFVPGGTYIWNGTVTKTLTCDVGIRLSAGAYIKVMSAADCFVITSGNYKFSLVGYGEFASFWTAPTNEAAVVRQIGSSLKRGANYGFFAIAKGGSYQFKYGLYLTCVNDSEFDYLHFNCHYAIYIEAAGSGSNAHAMTNHFNCCKFYAGQVNVTIVNNASLACEGFKFVGCDLIGQVGIRVIGSTKLGKYLPPELIIIGGHINAYQAVVAEMISRLTIQAVDFQSKYSSSNPIKAVIELYSVQGVMIKDNFFTEVTPDGSPLSAIPSQIYLAKYASGVMSISVNSGGSGYSSSPTVSILGSGSDATATATVSEGVITAITVINPGLGYATAPTIIITDSSGSDATATATVNDLQTAHVDIDGNQFLLNPSTTGFVVSADEVSSLYNVHVGSRNIRVGSMAWNAGAFRTAINLGENITLNNLDAAQGLNKGSATFSGGVLTVTMPSTGTQIDISASIVPNGSTVTQIICSSGIGRNIYLSFAGTGISFTHNANQLCPGGAGFTKTGTFTAHAHMYNSTQCIIMSA